MQLRAKEKARRKKCDVRFSLIKNNRVFQKKFMRAGVRKLLRTGIASARAWEDKPSASPPRKS